VGAAALTAMTAAGCSSSQDSGTDTAAQSSASAAASTATTEAPGTYGVPANPSATDPTNVAVDPPVTVTPDGDGGLPVVLTFADFNATTAQVEVDGYLPGIVEDGGTCTLTLTNGPASVTATVPGSADATTTSCGGAAVPRAELSPGTWTALLAYESTTSHGTSEPAEVTVP
jgi:hypothetical protein